MLFIYLQSLNIQIGAKFVELKYGEQRKIDILRQIGGRTLYRKQNAGHTLHVLQTKPCGTFYKPNEAAPFWGKGPEYFTIRIS